MPEFWDQLPIHVIDFEGSARSGIVEYGIVALNGPRIEWVETSLCAPTGKIRSEEFDTHGIDEGATKGLSAFSKQWERFASMRERGPLAAHFASAENSLIKSVFPFPRKSKDWIREGKKTAEWGPWIDTGGLYREVVPKADPLGLEVLVERFKLQEELDELATEYCPEDRRHYHCALYDALASALLLILFCHDHCQHAPSIQQLAVLSRSGGSSRQSAEQRTLF